MRSLICLSFLLSIFCDPNIAQTPLYPVKTSGKWGFINGTGQMVVPAVYDHVQSFESGRAVVVQSGKVGLIDSLGRVLIPCAHELLDVMNDSLILVRNRGEWSIQDYDGKSILKGIVGDIRLLKDGYLVYEQITGVGAAHLQKGGIIAPEYSQIEQGSGNQFIVFKGNKKGIFKNDGSQLFAAEFDEINRAADDYYLLKKDKKWGVSDTLGNWITEPNYQKIEHLGTHFLLLSNSEQELVLSLPMRKIICKNAEKITLLAEDMPDKLKINQSAAWGIMDTLGNWVLDCKYQEIDFFAANSFRVKVGEKWGIIGDNKQEILPATLDFIGSLSRTVAVAALGGKQGIIKMNGEWALEPNYENLPLADNHVYIKNTNNSSMMSWEFDEEGNLQNQNQYNNFRSIRVRSGGSQSNTTVSNARSTTPPNAVPQHFINDSTSWVFEGKSRLWGIKDTRNDKWRLPPTYSTFVNYHDLGFSVVSRRKPDIGGKLEFEGQEFKMNEVFGIVHNTRAMPITRLEFLDVNITDITVNKLPVARCIFVGGKHGLIARSGKVIASGYAFIGDFSEGKARACPKSTLLVDINERQPRNFGSFGSYMAGIMAAYSPSGYNNPYIEADLYRKGMLYCEEGKWGFIDTTGRLYIPAQYDYVGDFTENVAIARKGNKWGLLGADNRPVLDFQFDDLDYLPQTKEKLLQASRFQPLIGVIDSNGRVVISVNYERINPFFDGMAAVRKNGKWGYVNTEGKEVIPCEYRAVRDFSEGLAAVQQKGRWGFINTSGAWVIKAQYSSAGDFKQGVAWVSNGRYLYINPQGQQAITGIEFTRVNNFEDSLARVVVRGSGAGLLRLDGSWQMQPKKNWENIFPFDSMGMAKVRVGKRYELVNRSGEQPSKKNYADIRSFKEGFAVMRPYIPGGRGNSRFGLIDLRGKVVIPPKYEQLGDVHNGRLWFYDKGRYGFLDTKGNVIAPAEYHKVMDFSDGKAVVYTEYKHSGVIDTAGNYLVRPLVSKIVSLSEGILLVKQASDNFFYVSEDLKRMSAANFNKAQAFQYGVAPVHNGKKWGLVNEQGMSVGSHKYQNVQPYNQQGLATVKVERWEGVVDLKGKIIIPPNYEYIDYTGNGVFRVERNNEVGYLDAQGNWVWTMRE